MLDKQRVLQIGNVISTDYYDEWVAAFFELFELSRKKEIRNERIDLLRIQRTLADLETKLWDAQKEGREKAKELRAKGKLTQEEEDDLKGIEKHIEAHKLLVNLSRTIVDGIAWRNLNYDSFFMTAASRGFGTGAVNIDNPDTQSEFVWATRISNNFKSIVILNDLTHFLKVGDLTEIQTPKVAFIHEIKKLGAKVNNVFTLKPVGKAALSSQSKRLLELQRSSLKRSFETQEGSVPQRLSNVKIETNFHRLRVLLERAKKEIEAEEILEPCLTVKVTNFRALKNASEDDIKKMMNKRSDKDKVTLVHSNWDAFFTDERGNFLRSSVPYSVFPLPNRDCMDLMAGHVMVTSEFDIREFQRILRENNWEVSDIDLDPSIEMVKKTEDKMYSGALFENVFDDGIMLLKRGPFNYKLGLTLLTKISTQFFTLNTILKILEELYSNAAKIQKAEIFFPILKDKNIWN